MITGCEPIFNVIKRRILSTQCNCAFRLILTVHNCFSLMSFSSKRLAGTSATGSVRNHSRDDTAWRRGLVSSHRWENHSSLSHWTVRLYCADTCCKLSGRNEVSWMSFLVWISVFTILITEPVAVIPLGTESILLMSGECKAHHKWRNVEICDPLGY